MGNISSLECRGDELPSQTTFEDLSNQPSTTTGPHPDDRVLTTTRACVPQPSKTSNTKACTESREPQRQKHTCSKTLSSNTEACTESWAPQRPKPAATKSYTKSWEPQPPKSSTTKPYGECREPQRPKSSSCNTKACLANQEALVSPNRSYHPKALQIRVTSSESSGLVPLINSPSKKKRYNNTNTNDWNISNKFYTDRRGTDSDNIETSHGTTTNEDKSEEDAVLEKAVPFPSSTSDSSSQLKKSNGVAALADNTSTIEPDSSTRQMSSDYLDSTTIEYPEYTNTLSDTDEITAMTDMAHDGDDESTVIRRRDGLRAFNAATKEKDDDDFVSEKESEDSLYENESEDSAFENPHEKSVLKKASEDSALEKGSKLSIVEKQSKVIVDMTDTDETPQKESGEFVDTFYIDEEPVCTKESEESIDIIDADEEYSRSHLSDLEEAGHLREQAYTSFHDKDSVIHVDGMLLEESDFHTVETRLSEKRSQRSISCDTEGQDMEDKNSHSILQVTGTFGEVVETNPSRMEGKLLEVADFDTFDSLDEKRCQTSGSYHTDGRLQLKKEENAYSILHVSGTFGEVVETNPTRKSGFDSENTGNNLKQELAHACTENHLLSENTGDEASRAGLIQSENVKNGDAVTTSTKPMTLVDNENQDSSVRSNGPVVVHGFSSEGKSVLHGTVVQATRVDENYSVKTQPVMSVVGVIESTGLDTKSYYSQPRKPKLVVRGRNIPRRLGKSTHTLLQRPLASRKDNAIDKPSEAELKNTRMKQQEAVLTVLLNRPFKNIEQDEKKERLLGDFLRQASESVEKDEVEERLFHEVQEAALSKIRAVDSEVCEVEVVLGGCCKDSEKYVPNDPDGVRAVNAAADLREDKEALSRTERHDINQELGNILSNDCREKSPLVKQDGEDDDNVRREIALYVPEQDRKEPEDNRIDGNAEDLEKDRSSDQREETELCGIQCWGEDYGALQRVPRLVYHGQNDSHKDTAEFEPDAGSIKTKQSVSSIRNTSESREKVFSEMAKDHVNKGRKKEEIIVETVNSIYSSSANTNGGRRKEEVVVETVYSIYSSADASNAFSKSDPQELLQKPNARIPAESMNENRDLKTGNEGRRKEEVVVETVNSIYSSVGPSQGFPKAETQQFEPTSEACHPAEILNENRDLKEGKPSEANSDELEIMQITSADFEGIDFRFVEHYEELFTSFLDQNPKLRKNLRMVEILRVAKLQKLLAVTSEIEAELVDHIDAMEVQKEDMSARYRKKILEATKKKAARQVRLQQELHTIQQATQLMEGKLTWQLISKSESRAKRHAQILKILEDGPQIDPDRPLRIMPDAPETRPIVDAVRSPPTCGSTDLTEKQRKEFQQCRVDNAFLNSEMAILEKKLTFMRDAAQNHAWADAVFRKLTSKEHKKMKSSYQMKHAPTM